MRRLYGTEIAGTMRFPGRYRGLWYRRRVCAGEVCGECGQCGCYCRCWVGSECLESKREGGCLHVEREESGEFGCSRVGGSVREERDEELGVDEGIIDPDIPIISIETGGETCLHRMNLGTGKEDTMRLGEMVLDPDIPIPSIELDGGEHMEEEEPGESLVELQSGKDERRAIEEESSDILEARARDSHGTRCQDRTKLGRGHQQHLLTTSRSQICLREAVSSINIT